MSVDGFVDRLWRLPSALVAIYALTFGSINAVQAADAIEFPGETITLSVPAGSGAASCGTAKAETTPMKLRRSFFDPFDTLVLDGQGWLPHYDGGYDNNAAKWLGYDWRTKRTLDGNREQQLYVDQNYRGNGSVAMKINPFRIDSGVLSITADLTPQQNYDAAYGYNYTSGVLQSRALFTQQYGYFEIRARTPAGRGMWPAFWLLPTDRTWPPELDIMEMRGNEPNLVLGAIHWNDESGRQASFGCRTSVPTTTTEFHTYGALLGPDKITWFIDRNPVSQIATPPGFDKPFYMVVNLAAGSTWAGTPDGSTVFPNKLEVDWIAAYAWRDTVQ